VLCCFDRQAAQRAVPKAIVPSRMTSHIAPVMEVFASIQGEGAYVGEPQVFLRMYGCPLRCRWCDTPKSWLVAPEATARIDAKDGTRRAPAGASAFEAAIWVAQCERGAPRTVSVTGGEPLMWPDFLLALKSLLGRRRLHLETAGAHPQALARVVDVCDHVSLDLKPDFDMEEPVPLWPSDGTPRTREEWSAARRGCLSLVADRDACAKLVVAGDRAPEDYAYLFDEVEHCAPRLPVYLTPASPVGGTPAPTRALVDEVAEMARDRDLLVRVVPQVHRLMRWP